MERLFNLALFLFITQLNKDHRQKNTISNCKFVTENKDYKINHFLFGFFI